MGGWSPIADTWAYNSTDNPTGVINWTGANGKVSAGMRIRFNNGGNTIYGIVTAVTGSTMTFLHEMNEANNNAVNLMANSAITNPYISSNKAPLGFNLNPDRWSVIVTDTTMREQSNPGGGHYNLGSITLVCPIGAWNITTKYNTRVIYGSGTGTPQVWTGLSTSTSSFSDNKLYLWTASGDFGNISVLAQLNSFVILSSKTTYYALARVFMAVGAGNQLRFENASCPMILRATCAYL